jgi:hypothetical protein
MFFPFLRGLETQLIFALARIRQGRICRDVLSVATAQHVSEKQKPRKNRGFAALETLSVFLG